MSDRELEILRRKKLLELKRILEMKKRREEERKSDPREILNEYFVGRAWEVFNAAKAQYPQIARYVEAMLVRLIMEGKIKSKISGEELYWFFRRLGVRVRLKTSIRILEHGELKSLGDKLKEQLS